MSQIDFKQIKIIGQKEKDITYGYIKDIQSMFPDDNTYYTIVRSIQDIILLYFRILIDTKILTDDEQTKNYQKW